MDDVLCDGVGRCRLAAKDDGDGARAGTGLDVVVLLDEVERDQLLALVLVQTLGLDVEDGVGGFTLTFWVRAP